MSDRERVTLAFYDHHRQNYGALPLRDDAMAEFMVGDYDDGVGNGGEFRIALVGLGSNDFAGQRDTYLAPRIDVYGDAAGSLRVAILAGLLEALGRIDYVRLQDGRDEFSRRLIALGFRDKSDLPIGSGPPICHSCQQPVPREPTPTKEAP